MGLWEFLLGMTIVTTIGGVITAGLKTERHRLRSRDTEGEAAELKAMIADMHGDIIKLRDRVNVLERLATDGDRNLAAEIDRLNREKTSPRV